MKCCVGERVTSNAYFVAETYLIYPIVWTEILIVIFIVSSVCLKTIERKKERKLGKRKKKQKPYVIILVLYQRMYVHPKDFKISNESLTQAVRDCFRGSL